MPFILKEIAPKKYKVCLASNPSKCFSKVGLTKSNAIKQMQAIIISEKKKK